MNYSLYKVGNRVAEKMQRKYYDICLTNDNIKMLIRESYITGYLDGEKNKLQKELDDVDNLWRGYNF